MPEPQAEGQAQGPATATTSETPVTLKLSDLHLIAPEIVGCIRGPQANYHLTIKHGALHRTITIGDIHLYYARGNAETIDLIRAAVEQCKAGAAVYEPVDVGAERSAEMNSRLGYGDPPTTEGFTEPVRSVFEKPPKQPRFAEADSAFANRLSTDRRQREFYKSEHARKKARKKRGNNG